MVTQLVTGGQKPHTGSTTLGMYIVGFMVLGLGYIPNPMYSTIVPLETLSLTKDILPPPLPPHTHTY